MTNRALISAIKEGLKKINADTSYTNKGIWLKAKALSDALIKKDADSKMAFYKLHNIFTPLKIKTKLVSPLEDTSLAGLPLDCSVCRSEKRISKFVETAFGILYRSITSLDRSISFTVVTYSEYLMKRKIKYNTANYAWLEDGYMYFSKCFPEIICTAYFSEAEPEYLKKCTMLDEEFPTTDYLATFVIEETIKSLSGTDRIPADNVANKNTNS